MARVPLMFGIAALVAVAFALPGEAALIVHYDASDGSSVLNAGAVPASSGEIVGTWVDLAGGDQNGAPTVGSPVYNQYGGPLGKPAISFQGGNIVSGGATQARTVMMVHAWGPGQTGAAAYLLDGRAGIPNSYVYQSGIGGNWTAYVNDSTTSTGAIAALRSGNWQVTTLVGSSTATDNLHLYSRYTDNEFGWGGMAEVRVFDTALTEAERLTQVAELQAKWFTGTPPPNLPQLITPTSATSSTAASDLYPVIHLIDDSGFTGPVDIFNYSFVAHAGSGGGNSWVTAAAFPEYYTSLPPPVLTFTLPELLELTDVVTWNYSVPGNAAREFTIEFSTDGGVSFGNSVAGLIIGQVAGPSDTIPLLGGPYLADAVRITLTDNYYGFGAGGDRVGLSEIKFIGQTPIPYVIPEPATMSLALLGVAALARRRRRAA